MKTKESPESEKDSNEGILVPEEFQQKVHGLVKMAKTHEHLDHISSQVSKKRNEIYKSKESKKPKDFDSEGMPSTEDY